MPALVSPLRLTLRIILCTTLVWISALAPCPASEHVLYEDASTNPYDAQIDAEIDALDAGEAARRRSAAERLGFLRAYRAESALLAALADEDAVVRREIAMALAWCGGRPSVAPLIAMLDDPDWTVRQSAHASLTNLTGMEFPFDALADEASRGPQTARWRRWWKSVPEHAPPPEILAMLETRTPWGANRRITTSTTYKGPPEVLFDGRTNGAYWQTKNVAPPQWIAFHFDDPPTLDRLVIHQYSESFAMTGYVIEVSGDGERFETVAKKDDDGHASPIRLEVQWPARPVRAVRITSLGAVNPTYPTTFFEVELLAPGESPLSVSGDDATGTDEDRRREYWRCERALRALGALGGAGADRAVLEFLTSHPPEDLAAFWMVRTGIRSLGRLRTSACRVRLEAWLDNTMWARFAADALGDLGDRRAVAALLAVYPRYAKGLALENPPQYPRDDYMTFPSIDRMFETPYYILLSLARLGIHRDADRAALAAIAPRIMANLPGDHDTFFLVEPEVGHRLTAHLMEKSGRRHEAIEHAFTLIEATRSGGSPPDAPSEWSPLDAFDPGRPATWLPVLCRENDCYDRLVALLDHDNGWVAMNAAKALVFMRHPRAAGAIASRLRAMPPEAAYGFSPTFKDEEYNDPAPRRREVFCRALGRLGARESAPLLVSIMNDERSVAEVRNGAALALAQLGTDEAVAALRKAAVGHDIFCVRDTARDGLRALGLSVPAPPPPGRAPHTVAPGTTPPQMGVGTEPNGLDAIVFIKGSNDIPNTKGTVEQADRWRSEYVVTDSGPAYRPGRNLWRLDHGTDRPQARPLTRFDDGYVAEPDVTWDGRHVLFCRREEKSPWWHIYRVGVDGSGLVQLTRGPYHHVGPAELPDGRIVFATSRSGIRDEYHGYPCTVLCVMNADGSDIERIGANIGRDNEPAIMPDGRIVFSRLEVFYSRNKTELMLHAMHPDGTRDVVLYGPERRTYWRQLDHGPRTPADGQESPLTHRVLRMTQPRAMPNGRDLVVSTQAGLTLLRPRRDMLGALAPERNLMPDYRSRSYTTPYPLADGRILCASTPKVEERKDVDLGLYLYDPASSKLELLYNDPDSADFEPIPIAPRPRPRMRPRASEPGGYSGRFVCTSVFATQEPEVPLRGRFVRLIEGVPASARHSTQTNQHEVWKNHGGTFARVLGTVPLAADGSFYIEAPAYRLLHFQVLDSDRRVVGNQKTWIYPAPGETKSCVGCHEHPHTTTRGNDPLASHRAPVDMLPEGDEFTYRAKAWFKGHLPDQIEERTRTVRAVNLFGR